MKILITGSDTWKHVFGDLPEVGQKYYLVDAEEHSVQQMRTVHPLIQAYFESGCYSDDVDTWQELKEALKERIGPSSPSRKYDLVVWFDPEKLEAGPQAANTWRKVPKYIRNHPQRDKITKNRLRSMSGYTKKEVNDFITALIAEMETTGVNTPKYREIRRGMEKDDWS